MKKLLCFVAVAASAFLSSCSSDDNSNNNNTPEETQVTSIVLSSNIATVQLGGSFTFNVADQTGRNLTNDADITVNNVAIEGNTFTPTEEGTFTVKATYQTFTSNTVTVTVTPASVPETPQTENTFKINDTEYSTDKSLLAYFGTDENNVSYWAAAAIKYVDETEEDIQHEADVYFTTNQVSEVQLDFPTVSNLTLGTTPGTIEAYVIYGDTEEEYPTDALQALDLNITSFDIGTEETGTNWSYNYTITSNSGNTITGNFNGAVGFLNLTTPNPGRKSNSSKMVKKMSKSQIVQLMNKGVSLKK